MIVAPGSQNVTTYFALRLAADGTELTGATVTNMDLQYVRSGAAPVTKADATSLGAVDAVHTDNAAFEVDATDQPGLYRVDWPDAAFLAGVREVLLTVKYATAFTEHLRVEISPAVALADGSITAAVIADNAIDNAALAADIGSTAYATNIIALAVRKVLDTLGLDHLVAVATAGADMTAEVIDNSVISRIIGNGDTSTFVPSTDGLRAAGVDLDAILADTPTAVENAAAVMAVTPATYKGTAGSTGQAIYRMLQRMCGKIIDDRAAGTIKTYEAAADGGALMVTQTMTTVAYVDTITPS